MKKNRKIRQRRMWWLRMLLLAMCGLALCAGNTWAAPITYTFYNITNNNPGDAAIGEAQLFVDVDAGATDAQVLFTFRNIGPEDSSITDVYFDDGTLLGIASIDDSDDGVSFSEGASPGDLPGGNEIDPPFVATAGFLADSDSPQLQQNGVNPGEYLGIVFDLQEGKIFNDVINDLSTGALRIGIHVQGFESEGSEGFVNNVVPIPSALLLLGSGLLGLFGVSRKLKD